MVNNRVDRDDDALFVKDGVPVKFCFHKSVTQGRGQITRDVERRGGQIVADERTANVLLVDEEEDIAFLRRRYYSSTELYRLSLYVEPRGFVQTCIRSGTYHHVAPVRGGMPGRPGRGRIRVPFTEEDRDHLAYYLATRCPTRDGRLGLSVYKDLEQLGQTEDPSWQWARRHTFHSWREHYKIKSGLMDPRIDRYLQQLKDIGHHFGQDTRSHDRWNLRRELAEEEEDDDDDEEIERRVRPAEAAPGRPDRATRDHLVREDEEDDGDIQEIVCIQTPQRVKRHRAHSDAHRRRDSQAAPAKNARVSEVLSNKRPPSGVEAGRGQSSPAREDDADIEESLEIEGSDIFGDREYEELHSDADDQGVQSPLALFPRTSPVLEQNGPPLSTQPTLIASPRVAEKEATPAPVLRPTKALEVLVQMPPSTPTAPPSSPSTLIMTEERVVVERARARGASAQPGPSMPRERKTQAGAAVVDGPYRNTRARSRSVEPQSQAARQRKEDRRGRGKGKPKEDVLIEENLRVEEEQSEMTVEGLLEESIGIEADESSDEDIMPDLPRFQEVEIGSAPSDSDDAETHGSLIQGDVGGESGSEQEQDEDQVKQMASGKRPVAPAPRVTRSKAATQTHTRAATTVFPSPGTKARVVVDRVQEDERRVPYTPPQGSRAARMVKGKVKRG